jgi:hypothetical protein
MQFGHLPSITAEIKAMLGSKEPDLLEFRRRSALFCRSAVFPGKIFESLQIFYQYHPEGKTPLARENNINNIYIYVKIEAFLTQCGKASATNLS